MKTRTKAQIPMHSVNPRAIPVHRAGSAQTSTQDAHRSLNRDWADRTHETAGVRVVARQPLAAAQDLAASAARGRLQGEHVHFVNAWSVALSGTEQRLRDVFAAPRGWNLPDGRPIGALSRLKRDQPALSQVRGPRFMLDVCDLGRAHGLTHFLLGGSPEVLELLEQNLLRDYPGIRIVGKESPPYRDASPTELEERDRRILISGAQVVWVGLGTPKQDFESARLAARLPVVAVAVGAAFDYAAGVLRPAPSWVARIGLEWFWRLCSEPRRLWRRYTIGSAQFLAMAFADLIGPLRFESEGSRKVGTEAAQPLSEALHRERITD